MSSTETQTRSITAENILRLFPEIDPSLATSAASTASPAGAGGAGGAGGQTSSELEGYNEEQVRLMEEVCIVLDMDDKPIGSASKKACHLMKNIDRGLLHRAFSVFLFNPDDKRLLLQQRADEKITFPAMWTNTCCSHPLGIPGETGADLEAAIQGVRRAAVRKLDQELGIPSHQVPLDKFKFLTRMYYKAPSDGLWGEHEIDYILFIQAKVDLNINPNEVQAYRYVSPDELKKMMRNEKLSFTPWFRLICDTMLHEWWENLDNLDSFTNETQIRRM